MKPKFLIFTFFVIFLFSINSLIAQQKFEREMRIEPKEVPAQAIEFVQQLQLASKIKWFKETGLNSTTFEAKTKSNRKKYSIEFDPDGNLEDIEIIISKKKIQSDALQSISQRLQKDLKKFKWGKIQIQYSGDIKAIKQKITLGNNSNGLIIQYEIIVSAKVNKRYQKFEYLFSNTGVFIQRKNIILQNTDNLEY